MSSKPPNSNVNRTQIIVGVSVLAVLGVTSGLLVQELTAERKHLREKSSVVATLPKHEAPAVPSAAPSSSPPRSRQAVLPQKKPGATPEPANVARGPAGDWLSKARDYRGEDRAAVLDEAMRKVVAGGAASVLEMESELAERSVYDQEERAAAFHALGRIGAELAGSSDPKAKEALEAIQRMAKAELELPNLIEPNPEIDLAAMSERERGELVHHGDLVEENGELWHPTTVNKLAAIRVLRKVGGDDSKAQLEKLAQAPNNPPGVKFAVDQALGRGVPN